MSDPYQMNVTSLRRRAKAVYLAADEGPATDISKALEWAADRIEALEAALREIADLIDSEAAARIEALEAALHKIDDITIDHTAMGIARKALASAALATDTSVEDTIEAIKEKHR